MCIRDSVSSYLTSAKEVVALALANNLLFNIFVHQFLSKRKRGLDYDFDDDDMDDDSTQESTLNEASKLNEEAAYICNSCGEEIVVPLDYSEGQRQEYVEDCPVCCNPNVIFVEYDSDGEANIWSRAEQDPN